MNYWELTELVQKEHADDLLVATLYGLGDTYMIVSYGAALQTKRQRRVVYVVKASHVELVRMFDASAPVLAIPDNQVGNFFQLMQLGRSTEHNLLHAGRIYNAHPSAVLLRPDVVGRMTHARMYAAILGLPENAPRTLPEISGASTVEARQIARDEHIVPGKTAVLFPYANSYPAPDPHFWHELKQALRAEGWHVWVNDPALLPLRCVLPFVEHAGWAIGANCGMMQTIISSQVACRKTLVTREATLRTPCPAPHYIDVDGLVYDIEEFTVPLVFFGGVVKAIAQGRCSRGPDMSPRPQMSFDVAMSPGELIDRYTILCLKQERLPAKAHMVAREKEQLRVHRDAIIRAKPHIASIEDELRRLNAIAWDNNQILFELYENSDIGLDDWKLTALRQTEAEMVVKAFGKAGIVANQERIRLKNRINDLCGSVDREQKSYET